MARTRRPYRRQTPPKDMGETSICGSRPNARQRAKLAQLTEQWRENVQRPSLRGGNYLWAKTGPVSRDGNYCLTVKVYNAKPEKYWLPYHLANDLWLDVTGEPLSVALREDAGLSSTDDSHSGTIDPDTTALLDEMFAKFS